MEGLGEALERLLERTDTAERLRADPVSLARRYADPADREVAALVAAQLAFGQVDRIREVVGRVLDIADAHGGPAAMARGFDPARHGEALRPLVYRWLRGPDLVLLWATLGGALRRHGSLEALFRPPGRSEATVRASLAAAVAVLREEAVERAASCGLEATGFSELPRGSRYLLASPDGGSACKRWNLFLRWVVRPDDGVDLGLWTALPASALVIPLDTHVLRIARRVGLTGRTDGSWRTAEEITSRLRRLDPEDPVRFDFALAHVGIAGACREGRCDPCPLAGVCEVSPPGAPPRRPRDRRRAGRR